MGYYYLPGTQGGNPWRALKILLQFLLWASLIGIVILLWKKIVRGDP